jgi:hypothetical protein
MGKLWDEIDPRRTWMNIEKEIIVKREKRDKLLLTLENSEISDRGRRISSTINCSIASNSMIFFFETRSLFTEVFPQKYVKKIAQLSNITAVESGDFLRIYPVCVIFHSPPAIMGFLEVPPSAILKA